jgi:hypothetical protein
MARPVNRREAPAPAGALACYGRWAEAGPAPPRRGRSPSLGGQVPVRTFSIAPCQLPFEVEDEGSVEEAPQRLAGDAGRHEPVGGTGGPVAQCGGEPQPQWFLSPDEQLRAVRGGAEAALVASVDLDAPAGPFR